MAGRRDGAGEEHFGGRGKIAAESSAVVCLTEESGITLEELLTEEDRTRLESMNASTGGSFTVTSTAAGSMPELMFSAGEIWSSSEVLVRGTFSV